MMTIIKAFLLLILVFLAVIGLATIVFLVSVADMDEDGIENKESK